MSARRPSAVPAAAAHWIVSRAPICRRQSRRTRRKSVPERCRDGVRQHVGVVVRRERDRGRERRREERAERPDERPRKRIGRGNDRGRDREAEGDDRPDSRSGDRREEAGEERGERAVVVDEVDVRELTVGDERAREDVVARVAVEVAPRPPGDRRERDPEDGEAAERERVCAERDPQAARLRAQLLRVDAHAASCRRAPSRSRMPGTTLSATPITAWPLTISG